MGPIAAIIFFGLIPLGTALLMLGLFVAITLDDALAGVPPLAYVAWAFFSGTLLYARSALRRARA